MVAEHFRWCTTLFPSYPNGLKLVLTYIRGEIKKIIGEAIEKPQGERKL